MATPQHPLPIPSPGLDIDNIQGDVVQGLKKNHETFLFFRIQDVPKFKQHLKDFIPNITTTRQAMKQRDQIEEHRQERKQGAPFKLIPTPGINISFSQKGLTALGLTQSLGDKAFAAGQALDANGLGDPGQLNGNTFDPDWLPGYKQEFHGVFLVCSESTDGLPKLVDKVKNSFGPSINVVHSVTGDVRPGKNRGHEHFGYLDGISQPSLKGFGADPPPKTPRINPGIIVCGLPGDPILPTDRPKWALNGSVMAFRQLKQLVPEFDAFLAKKGASFQSTDLLGTRCVGRWKSGASADLAAFVDNAALATNNNFNYTDDPVGVMCPMSSHVRKMNPRDSPETSGNNTRETAVDPHRVMRAGIPFGPEVSDQERQQGVTSQDRGLLFVSYQADLNKGFSFLQRFWANNQNFPRPPVQNPTFHPGFDPIIGIKRKDVRQVQGLVPFDVNENLDLDQPWVVPQGGEYFFTPSIKALKEDFTH